jgi:hypothetical protein
MRKPAIAVVVVATLTVAALVFATWGAQAHTTSFVSIVTIHQVDSKLKVAGSVRSPNRRCRTHREVTVLRKRPGPDARVATVSTGSDRFWGPVNVHRAGTYYAHVKRVVRTSYLHVHTCLSDKSNPIDVHR